MFGGIFYGGSFFASLLGGGTIGKGNIAVFTTLEAPKYNTTAILTSFSITGPFIIDPKIRMRLSSDNDIPVIRLKKS